MSDDQMSTERKLAAMKMQEAVKAAAGRHPERGVEMMMQVIEMDPKFIEPRLWLAEFYLANDKKHMAVSQYEEVLHIDSENEEIWSKLREVDPATADRLHRMQNVAPDPFIAGRANVDMSDLEDFEDDGFIDDDDEAAPHKADHAASDIFMDDDAGEQEYYEPLPWEHEQEREHRDKLDESEAFVKLLNGYADLWYDEAACAELLGGCAEADAAVAAVNEEACAALGAETTRVVLADGWVRVPLTAPMETPTVIISAHAPEVFTLPELKFWLAWACHNMLSGAGEYDWAAEAALPHTAKVDPLTAAIKEAAAARIEGWDEGVAEDDLHELARDCQAWEMRAVMSADRAGLLVVGEEAVARRAIAGGSVDLKHAASVTTTQFLGLFRAKETKELARITVKNNPWMDPQYAAYRSHFLRYWATTDEFKALQADLTG